MGPDDRRKLLVGTAAVLGIAYLAVGAIGFAITGADGWTDPNSGDLLLIFQINPTHNVVHLLIGAALVAGAAKGAAASRGALIGVGVAYLAVGIAGFFLMDTEADILSLNQADNWLHIGTAIVALGVVAIASSTRDDHRGSATTTRVDRTADADRRH